MAGWEDLDSQAKDWIIAITLVTLLVSIGAGWSYSCADHYLEAKHIQHCDHLCRTHGGTKLISVDGFEYDCYCNDSYNSQNVQIEDISK